MSVKPILLDKTGQKMVDALNKIARKNNNGGGNGFDYELAQTLSGNEEDKAPSVKAVNDGLAKKVDIDKISLGLYTDGLLYTFIDGVPTGNGIALPSGTGDVVGNVDSENNIVLTGNLTNGTYTIKYEMEDGSVLDIGELVLDTNTYWSVTKNLTNCVLDNSATKVVAGGSYSATVTASDGYELSTVTVTMGGSAVSVSGGSISIASVTGDIVITAVASEAAEAEPVTENITLTDAMSIVLDTTGSDRINSAGYCATPHIDVRNIPKPCTIHLTKAKWSLASATESGYVRFFVKDISGNKIVCDYTYPSKMPDGVTMVLNNENAADVTVTVNSDNIGYVRFAGRWSGGFSDSNDSFAAANTKATLTYTPAS